MAAHARPRICLEAAYLGAAGSLMGLYLPLPAPRLAAAVEVLARRQVGPPLQAPLERLAEGALQAGQRNAASLRRTLVVRARMPLKAMAWAGNLKNRLARAEEKKEGKANP